MLMEHENARHGGMDQRPWEADVRRAGRHRARGTPEAGGPVRSWNVCRTVLSVILFFVCSICFVRPGSAQSLAEIGFQYSSEAGLDDAPTGFEGLGLGFARFDVKGRLPIPLSKTEGRRSFLVVGGTYQFYLSEAIRVDGEVLVRRNELHTVGLPISFIQQFGRRWTAAAAFAPGLSGDFIEIRNESFRFLGSAFFTHRLNESLLLGGGVLVTNLFGEVLPLPYLRLSYIKPKLRIDLRLPREISFVWPATDWFELGVGGLVRLNYYSLTDRTIIDTPSDAIATSQIELGLVAAFRVTEPLWFTLSGGPVLNRRFDFVDSDGDTLRDFGTDPAAFVQLTFEVRRPRPKGPDGEKTDAPAAPDI